MLWLIDAHNISIRIIWIGIVYNYQLYQFEEKKLIKTIKNQNQWILNFESNRKKKILIQDLEMKSKI